MSHPKSRPLMFFDNYDMAPTSTGPGVGLYSGNMGKYKSVKQFLKHKKLSELSLIFMKAANGL